jgi:hypothetical protein
MLLSMRDVEVGREHRRELLRQAQQYRMLAEFADSHPQPMASRVEHACRRGAHWLGSRFVTLGETMQRRYAS